MPESYDASAINEFIKVIREINPALENIKLLLITNNSIQLDHPSVFQVFYNKHSTDPYCRSTEINTLFTDSLSHIGYNIHDTTHLTFTDKS